MIVAGVFADVEGVWRGQVLLRAGKIAQTKRAELGTLGTPTHAFADDCLIFAGMGDIHIHAREDVTGLECHKETFATASAAALTGGVVHVADMPNNKKPPVDDDSYQAKRNLVDRYRLPVHFTLYAGIGPDTSPLSIAVPYKAYMGPSVGHLFFSSLDDIDRALTRYQGCDVSFHCEDPILLDKHKQAATHELRRPPECELSATHFALHMIEKHKLRGKLCHYSVGEGLPAIRAAKQRGLPVTVEVTPHHLFFDTTNITETNRPWMQMNPPLRSLADREAMLDAVRDGTIDYLATDHAPHTLAEKTAPGGHSGQPHLDTYGAFVSWLLVDQKIKPERVAELCSANPGKFVEPYVSTPFGRLQEGYTGRLTVINLNQPTTITKEMLKTKCAWSPFEGFTFPGRVEQVIMG